MWRPVSKRRPPAGRAAAALLLIALPGILLAAACNPEADLIAYFGTPRPSPSQTTSTVHTDPAEPTPAGQPASPPPGSATPAPTTAPTTDPAPTGEPTPTATPAWSPMPTRPPGLADFAELREAADVTDVSRLAANPDGLSGVTVYFEGRVNEVVEDGSGHVRARVRVGDVLLYIVYRRDRYWGDHPLVQGDRIRVVGEFVGLGGPGDGERLPEIEPIDIVHRFA